jgi:hypothetical protein
MHLFRITLSAILHRKTWVICLVAALAFPFLLPTISSATEKPVLLQPARVLGAWNTLWFCTILWGFSTAARQGEDHSKSGLGEYFLAAGLTPARQLFEIWLAVLSFIVPLTLLTVSICLVTAMPADPAERGMWWVTNLQYAALFLLVCPPLAALATAIGSRFGAVAGFALPVGICLYGLWGTGYLANMLSLEENPALQFLWIISPQYGLADLTQRLEFKMGALPNGAFQAMVLYFSGILVIYAILSRLLFRCKTL